VRGLKQTVKTTLDTKGLTISEAAEWGKKARGLALGFERECMRLDSAEFANKLAAAEETGAKTARRRIVREIQFELRFLDEFTRLLSASTDLSKLVRETTVDEVTPRARL